MYVYMLFYGHLPPIYVLIHEIKSPHSCAVFSWIQIPNLTVSMHHTDISVLAAHDGLMDSIISNLLKSYIYSTITVLAWGEWLICFAVTTQTKLHKNMLGAGLTLSCPLVHRAFHTSLIKPNQTVRRTRFQQHPTGWVWRHHQTWAAPIMQG